MNWHLLPVPEVLRLTGSNFSGLTDKIAAARLEEYGTNELQETKKKSPLMMFLRQFMDVMILVLVAAFVITLLFLFPPRNWYLVILCY